MDQNEKLRRIVTEIVDGGTMKKIVFSKPEDKSVIRTECRTVLIKDKPFIQLETFTTDGKARHRNIPVSEAADALIGEFSGYRQMNVITTGGNAEARVSSKGKLTVIGNVTAGETVAPAAHDRKKIHILNEGNRYDFLVELGVTDGDGAIFDRRRSKFRQIDRFLQYISDIYPRLRGDGELYVLDLCCGKSYLTFAAYWYLTSVKGRAVKMVGADLKEDVIGFCSGVAEKLSYTGLSFLCLDITKFEPERKPDLVLSLHACDIATDVVLTTAARLGADVILSTPCCQHQVMSQLNGESELGKMLAPILEQSLLKQKLAVALTDALRCKRLQAAGYSVDVTELIDPEDTPKNLMIRAVKVNMSPSEKSKYLREFLRLEALAGVEIYGGTGERENAYFL